MTQSDLWSSILQYISKQISKPSFDTWFKGTDAVIDGNVLIISANNEFAADWLEERYSSLIFDVARKCTGKAYKVKITPADKPSLEKNPHTDGQNEWLEELINNCIEQMTKELSEKVKNHEERILELEKLVQTDEIYNKFIPFEDEVMQKKTGFDIEGHIEADADIDEDTFYSEFQDWLDSKGFSFVGITKMSGD